MGHKRKEPESSAEEIVEHDVELEALLRQHGLPAYFGKGSFSREQEGEPSQQEPIEQLEDEEEEISIKPRGQKRGKKGPRLSLHHTISHSFSTREILAYYPNGLVYQQSIPDSTSIDTNTNKTHQITDGEAKSKLHIHYDDEGQPIVDPETMSASLPSLNGHVSPILDTDNPRWLEKYHRQRYDFFHRFDEGIQLDEEGWYSVTPEKMAAHIANQLRLRLGTALVLDAFAGVGGNTVQFALAGFHVIATDINAERLLMARNNAHVYGVDDYVDFIVADYFALSRLWRTSPRTRKTKRGKGKAKGREAKHKTETTIVTTEHPFDVIFSSPPWGGPKYFQMPIYDPTTMLGLDGVEMIKLAVILAQHTVYYLPRQTDVTRLCSLLPLDSQVTIEEHSLADRPKALVIYNDPLVCPRRE